MQDMVLFCDEWWKGTLNGGDHSIFTAVVGGLLLAVARSPLMWYIPLILVLLLAGLAWWLSRLDFVTVRAYVDGIAPDSSVETYDIAFHRRVMQNLRWAASALGVAAIGIGASRHLFARVASKETSGWTAFRSDLRKGMRSAIKRTSDTHKRFVLLILSIGALLRISQLWEPVIYDEAFTYIYFAVRPFHVIISDYAYPNNHILHTILLKVSTSIFGVGRVSLRLPAVIAGILVMPMFYLFVRSMFNRYIALIALSFVAASGCLIEYSSLGRGYSITWMFMIATWMMGRHFAKTNNTVSAVLFGVLNALGMWTVPTMMYMSAAGFLWLTMYLGTRYSSSLNKRMYKLVLAFAAFIVVTLILYAPVIIVHGAGQLFHHSTMGDTSWEQFSLTHQDRSLDLFAYINDTAATWISILGFISLLYAAYVSSKYRILLFATVLGAIPLVILQSNVGPPRIWLYTLFVMHLGSAIAIFYLLKLIQESVYAGLAKRMRTVVASMVILVGMGFLGMRGIQGRIERFPEASSAAQFLMLTLGEHDRVLVEFPMEAPLEFEFMRRGMDNHILYREAAANGQTYVVTSPPDGQTLMSVLNHHRVPVEMAQGAEMVKDQERSEIFALPKGAEFK